MPCAFPELQLTQCIPSSAGHLKYAQDAPRPSRELVQNATAILEEIW